MNSQFEKDFTQLNQKLISGKPYSEIRKEYLKLVKKYHPDKAETSKKKLYEEYTIKIVNLYQNYMDKKIAAVEIDLAKQKKQAQNQPDKKHDAATNPAQDSTYIKLMEVARKEYTVRWSSERVRVPSLRAWKVFSPDASVFPSGQHM